MEVRGESWRGVFSERLANGGGGKGARESGFAGGCSGQKPAIRWSTREM